MKYFSVLLCLFLCYELSTQDPMRRFHGGKRSKEFYSECRELSGLTREELKKYEHSGEEHEKLLNGDGDFKNIGCYFACLNEKYGIMTGNTFIRQDLLFDDSMEKKNPEMAERRSRFMQTANDCMDIAEATGGDECEVALVYHVCFETSRRDMPPLS